MALKALVKSLVNVTALALMLPSGLACGFGRFAAVYSLCAQGLALAPGLPGDYLRSAFYRWTLRGFGADSRVQFGSYFAHSQAKVGSQVYIGGYTILGCVEIGDRTQIASGVQILSGRRQHSRGEQGRIQGSAHGQFETLQVGADCWIGAGALVMADVAEGSTIGAGAVVVKPIPARSVAVGNPARVVGATAEPGKREGTQADATPLD